MRATLYLTTGLVGGTSRWLDPFGEGERPMMTWDQIDHVARSGIECGGHTVSHPELDAVLPSRAAGEIRDCRVALRDAGLAARSFSYPHGYHSFRVRRLVAEHGFDSACAVGGVAIGRASDPFRIGRTTVLGSTTEDDLEHMLASPNATRYGRRFRAAAWRGARRARLHRLRPVA